MALTSKGSNLRFKPFGKWRDTFPTGRIQSLTSAYMGQQGRLIVFHYVDHQFHAKSESSDKHIPLGDRGYVGDALGELA